MKKTFIKIICLGLGLAMGLLLIAKVYFEQTYDTFFPNAERLYKVNESVVMNGEYEEYGSTAGAIGPGIKEYTPQVEAATRYTYLQSNTTVETDDKRKFSVKAICLADSCFFDVLPRDIIAGDYKQVLAVADQCMIPRSLAEKIGGNVVGMRLNMPEKGADAFCIVGGVYEDYPLNSDVPQAIYMSLKSIGKYRYDGTENWIGNDCYQTYVRLADGAAPQTTVKYLDKMIQEHVSKEDLDMFQYKVRLTPLKNLHLEEDSVKTTIWILTLLAVLLLVSASLNYLLIVFGQMVGRSKEMAVRKCYGTSPRCIIGMVLRESALHLLLSLGVAVILLYAFQDEVGMLLGATVTELLLNQGIIWILAGVCLLILLVTGVLPGWIYARIPVSAVFRNYNASRRVWKRSLLAVQFVAAGFLFCLLILIGRQYSRMANDNPGYDCNNLLHVNLSGIPYEERPKAIEELKKLSCVKDVTAAYQNLLEWVSGDNVWEEGKQDKQFNIADMYWCSANFFSVLDIPIVQGMTFTERTDSTNNQVMVDEVFVSEMKKHFGWDDDVIGRSVMITGHEPNMCTIRGVFKHIRLGNICEEDPRGAVIFYSPYIMSNVYIRLNTTPAEAMSDVQNVISKMFPTRDITVYNFKTEMAGQYDTQRNFRDSVMIAGIVTIIIAFIGLIGYTADEVSRRSKEIAIRKVNGAKVKDIVMLFIKDMLLMSVPSLIIGGIVAAIVGKKWLSQFSEQVTLAPWLSASCIIAIVVLLMIVVVLNCRRIAISNPVDYLKSE